MACFGQLIEPALIHPKPILKFIHYSFSVNPAAKLAA